MARFRARRAQSAWKNKHSLAARFRAMALPVVDPSSTMNAPLLPTRYFIASGCPIATTTLYRCLHLQEQLQQLGYTAKVATWFQEAKIEVEDALGYDVIILYRLAMCPPLERLIGEAHQLGKLVVFDTDDLIFEPVLAAWLRAVKNLSASDQIQYLDGVRRYLETLLACDAVIAATPLLAELARNRGKPAFVHRNSLGREMLEVLSKSWEERQARATNKKTVIGYGSGTATHDVDFLEAAAALEEVLDRFADVELQITGPLVLPRSLRRFQERVRHYPLTDWRSWFESMSEMDIALAPLEMNNIFCRAKSEIKYIEAGALGLPVVASDIDPFRDSITRGRDGFLAANKAEWIRALTSLIEQPKLRAQIGEDARQTILRRYSPHARATELGAILPELNRCRPSK
jgi:glycosyltransferase involved in cell wall biosynthesis